MAGELTSEDVFAACEALAAEGVSIEKITGHAAWSRLGRGSKSTVQKYWREWRALQDETSALTRSAAMNAIQEMLDRLINQAVTEERHRAGAAIAQLEEQVRHLSKGFASALAETERLTAELNDATAAMAVENEKRQRAEIERDWLQNQLGVRDEDLADALAERQNRERAMTKAAGRLAAGLPRPR